MWGVLRTAEGKSAPKPQIKARIASQRQFAYVGPSLKTGE